MLPLTLGLPAAPAPEEENGAIPAQIPALGQGRDPGTGRRGRPSRAGSRNDRGVPLSSCPKPSCGLCLLSPSSLLVPPTRECRGEEGGREGWEAAPAGCRRRERPGARLGAAPAALGSSSSAALPSARGAAHQSWANLRRGVVWLCLGKEAGGQELCQYPLLHPAANSPLPVPPRGLCICSSIC